MIKFLIDSGSDYDKEQLQEKGIEYIPIAISVGDKSFRDGEISKDEFYKLTQESEEFPKTAQPSPQDFIDIFEKIKADGDELICILLSSGLSGLIQSATLAKNMVEYDKIHIVDSLSATFVIKVLVDYGIQLRDSGKTAEEIVAAIKEIQPKVRMYAVLDTLDNLYKGGRLSKIEAGIGTIAKIKPLIYFTEDGKVGIKAKSIGKKKALNDIMKLISNDTINTDFPVYSMYSIGTVNNETFTDRLKETNIEVSDRLQIGPTIGTHIGPEAYGIVYVAE